MTRPPRPAFSAATRLGTVDLSSSGGLGPGPNLAYIPQVTGSKPTDRGGELLVSVLPDVDGVRLDSKEVGNLGWPDQEASQVPQRARFGISRRHAVQGNFVTDVPR